MPQILTQNLKTHSKFWKLAQIFGVVVLTTNIALWKSRTWNLAQTPRKKLKTHEASTSPQCDVYYKIMRCCTKIDKYWVCLEIHLKFDRILGQRKHFWGHQLLVENYLEHVFNICNIWGLSLSDLLDIVLRYCLELDETMWWRKTITSAEATLILPPLHLYTAPPPPWEERHHHHCPKNVEQADTFWALIRSPAPSEAGLRIGEGFRAGFLPDGSRPGLRLQLLGWCCLRASCGSMAV